MHRIANIFSGWKSGYSSKNNVNEHPRRRKSPAVTLYKPIPRETGVLRGMERVWGSRVTLKCRRFAVPLFFAVLPLLSTAVLRCYFAAVGRNEPGFLRLREVLPLYFSGIISEISEC